MVVRLKALPRRAPLRCRSLIRRSTVQRATRLALSLHLGPDLVGPIDIEVLLVDPGDLGLEDLVAYLPRTRWSSLGGVVGPGSELQRGADRLDSRSEKRR